MAATSRRRVAGPIIRSLSPSPSGRFYTSSHASPATTSASAFSSSTNSSLSARSTSFLHRPASSTGLTMASSPTPSSSSIRISIDRSISPRNSSSAASSQVVQKRTCMCSPTTHPGSFRCSLHKNCGGGGFSSPSRGSYQSNRSATTNSLVRIGTVEGDLVRRAIRMLIRPSSRQQRRRVDFQPRPSRLSVMSKDGDS